MSRRAERIAVLAAAALLLACGEESSSGANPSERSDVELLRRALIDDPALGPLEEVERIAQADRPARAASLLERAAIPAAERQLARLEALEVSSPRARPILAEARAAYRDRLEALHRYKAVLERQAFDPDPEGHFAALRAQSTAERRLLAVHDALDEIVPPPRPEPRPEEEPSEPPPGSRR